MPWRNIAFFIAALCPAQAIAPSTQTIVDVLHAGHYSEARGLLRQALRNSPNDERLWTLDGFTQVHLGEKAAALASYRHALDLSPDYLPALEGAAEIQYSNSDQKAVPLLKKILQAHPADETAHAMLAALAFQRHDCPEAIQHFSQGGIQVDSKPLALQQYGSCLIQARQLADAVPIFERMVTLQPRDEKALYNLAVVQSLAGRHSDVIATLNQFVAQHPHDIEGLELLAEAYEATSQTSRAVQLLREAIIANPDVPKLYVSFANVCFVHSSFQVGIDIVNACLTRMPRIASLYLARGVLYVQLGRYDEAEADFSRVEDLDPESRFASSVQGLTQLQRDHLDQAEATIRSRIKKQPNDALLHYLLAETLARRGATVQTPRFEEAIRSAERAVKLDPTLALARDVLARLYLQQRRLPQAIEQSRLALTQDPSDQTAVYHLMQALRKSGDTSELPSLAKRLAQIREQAAGKEAADHKYALVEPGTEEHSGSVPTQR